MSSIDKKREDFRKYLDNAGAIENLTKALIRLYEQPNKPSDAVKFLRKYMCESCPDEEQYEMLTADLNKANIRICELERELSRMKGSVRRSPSEIDLALTRGFDELSCSESDSLLKKFLTKDFIEKMKEEKTCFKGTLLDCIQAGLELFNTPIGAFACDSEAYVLFAELFDPIIEELHTFKSEDKQPDFDWGESCKLPDLDPDGEFITSIRIHCIRSVESFPFAAIMTFEQYEEILGKMQAATKCLSGDLKGNFYALEAMDDDLKKCLTEGHLLFKENNEVLKAANGARFWPTGRGIFINEAQTFVIWCNEEDHLRFISTEQGGNLRNAYERLVNGVTQVTKDICTVRDERLGYMTFSPKNLGNTLKMTVHIKLEKLPEQEGKLCELSETLQFEFDKVEDSECNLYEISNKKRLGVSECETVNGFADAIIALIAAEKNL